MHFNQLLYSLIGELCLISLLPLFDFHGHGITYFQFVVGKVIPQPILIPSTNSGTVSSTMPDTQVNIILLDPFTLQLFHAQCVS